MIQIIFPVFIAIFAIALYNYQIILIADLDWISYLLAKSTLFSFPKVYPKNQTEIIQTIRTLTTYPLQYGLHPLVKLFNPSLATIPIEDVYIPVDEGKGEILLRLYHPEKTIRSSSSSSSKKYLKKVLIFYHGGGWIFFSAKDLHTTTLHIAQQSGYLVVSVDYRLAPEYVFPTAVNDAYAALEWVIQNIEQYGGDPNAIVLAGESAGGNLAAAVTSKYLGKKIENHCEIKIRPRDSNQMICKSLYEKEQRKEKWHEIVGLWLIYPILNATTSSSNAQKYGYVNGFLTIDEVEWMRRLYQGSDDYNEEIRTNYLYSPSYTPNMIISVYPSTFFTFAEHDVLTAEGFEFVEKLRAYIRPVHSITFSSTVHAFLSAHPFLGTKAIAYAVNYMHKSFR